MEELGSLPVLVIGFNRPDLFQIRLEELRDLPIKRLYITVDSTVDGINPEIRNLIDSYVMSGLQFHVLVNYESQNTGLTRHITNAISRVLTTEKAVIVIEDDISISAQSYSAFNAGYLLLQSLQTTGVVSGFSPLVQPSKIKQNFWRQTPYFSVWGWVATKENWQNYSFDISHLDIQKELGNSRTWHRLSRFQRSVWLSRFKRAQADPLLTWDIQMQFFSFRYDYSNLVPLFRVVENQGFGDPRAVHTKFKKPRWFRSSDPKNAVIPLCKPSRFVNFVGKLVDSVTIAGDSWMFHIWTHFIRKKLLIR